MFLNQFIYRCGTAILLSAQLLNAGAEETSSTQGPDSTAAEILRGWFSSPAEATPLSAVAKDHPTSQAKMVKVWSSPGAWWGVASDPRTGMLIAVGPSGKSAEIDNAGVLVREFNIDDNATNLRLAQLNDSEPLELLTYKAWGNAVIATTAEGKELWKHEGGSGIDDVWPGDLNGDGLDEVLVGYNGGTGLYALSKEGAIIWKHEKIANVWHVCVGNVIDDAKPEVVSTSARGQVHIFDASGKKLKDISPGFYCNMVRIASTTGTASRIIVTGSGQNEEVIASVNADGKRQWETSLSEGDGHVDSASVSSDGQYIAVGMRIGAIIVVDSATGEIVGRVTDAGKTPQVTWGPPSTDKQGYMLVVATGSSLDAFSLRR